MAEDVEHQEEPRRLQAPLVIVEHHRRLGRDPQLRHQPAAFLGRGDAEDALARLRTRLRKVEMHRAGDMAHDIILGIREVHDADVGTPEPLGQPRRGDEQRMIGGDDRQHEGKQQDGGEGETLHVP